MQAQLKSPLRLALACLALCSMGPAIASGAPDLMLSGMLGALALLGLAAWPGKSVAHGRYAVPLLMLCPLCASEENIWGAMLRLGLVTFALGLWAGMGLRMPKKSDQGSHRLWDLFGIVGLLALWATLGVMGGGLSALLWPGLAAGEPTFLLTGVVAVTYHHARFLLLHPLGGAEL